MLPESKGLRYLVMIRPMDVIDKVIPRDILLEYFQQMT